MTKFKVGDKFAFDIKLMQENGYSPDQYDNEIHKVWSVREYDGLGEIVGWWPNGKYSEYDLPAQCNAVWLKKI